MRATLRVQNKIIFFLHLKKYKSLIGGIMRSRDSIHLEQKTFHPVRCKSTEIQHCSLHLHHFVLDNALHAQLRCLTSEHGQLEQHDRRDHGSWLNDNGPGEIDALPREARKSCHTAH